MAICQELDFGIITYMNFQSSLSKLYSFENWIRVALIRTNLNIFFRKLFYFKEQKSKAKSYTSINSYNTADCMKSLNNLIYISLNQ